MNKVRIFAHKAHPDAIIPQVAYNGTSAAFDLTCIETTTIRPGRSAVIPNGLNLSIDQNDNYYMLIQLRSSMGFKKELVPHMGVVDAGYCGDLGVKIYNLGDYPVTIERGDRYAQILVVEKPSYEIIELEGVDWDIFKKSQERGDKGFGSSGK